VVAVDIEPGVLSSATVAEMAADHGARAVAAALSGSPASADIAPAFDESILVSVLVAAVYNLGRSRFFLLPVAVRLPGLPVSLKFMVWNIMVVPGMTMPVTGPETIPPSRIHVKIEIWNAPVINPSSVIIMGAIPSPFPGTPPPAAPEKKVHLDIRDNINIGGVG